MRWKSIAAAAATWNCRSAGCKFISTLDVAVLVARFNPRERIKVMTLNHEVKLIKIPGTVRFLRGGEK